MVVSVEDVSSSLVREYLSRKGLKRTMACMDEEHPRTAASINNRSHLRQILNMEALYKNNKVQGSPLKTLLEIIVKHHVEGSGRDKTSSDGSGPPRSDDPAVTELAAKTGGGSDLRSGLDERCPSEPSNISLLPKAGRLPARQAALWAHGSDAPEGQSLVADLQDSEGSIRREPEIKTPRTENTHRTRTNQMRRGMMTGPIASRPTPQDSNRKRQSQRVEGPQLLTKEENTREGPPLTDPHPKRDIAQIDCTGGSRGWRSRVQRENSFGKVGPNCPEAETCPAASGLSEMVLDDVDDDDDLRDLSKVSFERTVAEPSCRGRPMDQHRAAELKTLLLGSSLNCFSVEWRNQGFTFSETHDLRYGIVQKKGGPCGVLASIQAFVLKNLLFEKVGGLQRLRPSSTCRRKCLVLATAEILWRAGEEKQATLAVNSGRNHFTPAGHYKSEGVFEKITCFTVDSIKDLQSLVEQHIEQFETGALGCVLLTISAVLSRSVEKVREDMDVPTTTLVGAHGYCTQELVNLFLCGRAVSNVFDDDMELDSGNANMTLLKGIKGHCDIGLLSLFEHYNICKDLT
ncbi:probable ubiquitin carboxyl-terminal hydrolase MINDY-4 isoform X2 [Mastacembelus armatus]|uniref:probable ubiquitin carboxyl-terminal hydrolase MINDY-4 isoform X2 n=1 Tax=Mastacembelus armatus TaxID=205130 RepID=UPI000E45F99A|nr:probable ubiquitin carboxyl-terminal hydrolase MINDY-4 isoform X2 [Mastacembelus armatus]